MNGLWMLVLALVLLGLVPRVSATGDAADVTMGSMGDDALAGICNQLGSTAAAMGYAVAMSIKRRRRPRRAKQKWFREQEEVKRRALEGGEERNEVSGARWFVPSEEAAVPKHQEGVSDGALERRGSSLSLGRNSLTNS